MAEKKKLPTSTVHNFNVGQDKLNEIPTLNNVLEVEKGKSKAGGFLKSRSGRIFYDQDLKEKGLITVLLNSGTTFYCSTNELDVEKLDGVTIIYLPANGKLYVPFKERLRVVEYDKNTLETIDYFDLDKKPEEEYPEVSLSYDPETQLYTPSFIGLYVITAP